MHACLPWHVSGVQSNYRRRNPRGDQKESHNKCGYR